jgi:hypothetical protein
MPASKTAHPRSEADIVARATAEGIDIPASRLGPVVAGVRQLDICFDRLRALVSSQLTSEKPDA